ncbi:MAG TPA: ATP-dependent sacrificial sulfur transferase LarE [Thermoplasmata archaeon]|nr:ATP-dependent sacrificial sulfur transferase LarE [Thermoplasmata archaeon]
MAPLLPRSTPDFPLAAARLEEDLRAGGKSLVAMSGGVDSAVVALLAHRALGASSVAVTLAGPAVSDREVERAREVARHIGIEHVVLLSDPLDEPGYASNPTNRCYFCRRTETGALTQWGASHGVRRFLDGVHVDDLGEDRPGLRAMDEAGFAHPLVDAGWRKTEVRRFAKGEGLPNWDQPSDACLASRVRHGQPITRELLDRVRRAEESLLVRGFRRVRVRTDGRSARVEVGPTEVPRLLSEPLASTIRAEIVGQGFASVELDPTGYRPRPGA